MSVKNALRNVFIVMVTLLASYFFYIALLSYAKPIYEKIKANEAKRVQQELEDQNMKVTWFHILNKEGKLIYRSSVRGKVTFNAERSDKDPFGAMLHQIDSEPGAKPIPTKFLLAGNLNGAHFTWFDLEGRYCLNDYRGTRNYYYWPDSLGRLNQLFVGDETITLITNYPVDAKVPIDKATGLYNLDKEAYKIQLAEEAKTKTD